MDEARRGEPKLASERLEFLKEVALLDVTVDARKLAAALVRVAKVPEKAEMAKDPIVEEIHQIREELLKEYGGMDGYMLHLQQLGAEFKDRIVRREPRKPGVADQKAS